MSCEFGLCEGPMSFPCLGYWALSISESLFLVWSLDIWLCVGRLVCVRDGGGDVIT